MRAEELVEGGGPGSLQAESSGQRSRKSQSRRVRISSNQNLREIAFQEGCQTITDPGPVTRQAASLLD